MADSDNASAATAVVTPTSPAAHRAPIDGDTHLRELPWCGKINLRGDPNDARFMRAAADALGVELPAVANTVTAGEHARVFWLGADEWLAHCALDSADALLQNLRHRLAHTHSAATEVTDYYTLLELGGVGAAAALARGCPLDLHERVFKAGQCAQSRFGNASVLLYKPDHSSTFQIQVRWSFADYVWDYLAVAIDSL